MCIAALVLYNFKYPDTYFSNNNEMDKSLLNVKGLPPNIL